MKRSRFTEQQIIAVLREAEIRYRRHKLSPKQATLEGRMAAGSALRGSVPRGSHAEWSPSVNRLDPISILDHSDRGRLPELLPIRYGRMKQSPFGFYWGSAAVMAWDLSKTITNGIIVQACEFLCPALRHCLLERRQDGNGAGSRTVSGKARRG
jgi:hypothetical protein